MEKRLVTRYAMRSPEAADENQKRVEEVFLELAASKPDIIGPCRDRAHAAQV